MEGNMGNLECEELILEKFYFQICQGGIIGQNMAILDIFMVWEGTYAYEGPSLGIWKVIWVVEEIILEKRLFLDI